MCPEEIVQTSNYISAIMARITARGMLLEIGTDFDVFIQAIENQPKRTPVTPKFDPRIEKLDESNAFWILGRNGRGEVVHTQAIRVMDLNGGSLAEHIRTEFPKYTPPTWNLVSSMEDYRPGPGSARIGDLACYHGDFWIMGGPDGFRGEGMNMLAARLAMAICMVRWNPDYIYAYMHTLVACNGIAARSGFMHMEQNNLFWSIPGYDELLEAWMVWSSREDIMHFISSTSLSLADQLATSRPAEFDRKKRKRAAA